MEDLSARCIRHEPDSAPSVSYLSMIERGKRVPSIEMLETIALVFQKPVEWFLDDSPVENEITPNKGSRGGISGMALEPGFLFSNDILQIAIPEMLSQTGVSGRQFAHLLIRAYQEHHQNHFPDLERAAEEIGQKQMPISAEELMRLAKKQGLNIRWFDKPPMGAIDELGVYSKNIVSSYIEAPNTLYLNELLKLYPTRLKYELATHIGHSVLHNQDSLKSVMTIGGNHGANFNKEGVVKRQSANVEAQDILQAWRDFESSFFAGALLCPKVPFRQLLDRTGYEIESHLQVGVSASVAMRRMTAVSPYSHWHYFDAYSPGKLKAVYRGNGIPLPWGNMREVEDPCQHWAVFRKINEESDAPSAQLSILETNGEPRIYVCESVRVADMAGNKHVLCAGIDLNPAISAQGGDAVAMAEELRDKCSTNNGLSGVPRKMKKDLASVAKILNINWVDRAINTDAKLICPRGNTCPRNPSCYGRCSEKA
ncbi:DUF3612 domain-containing protein [Reinekea forsetii]|nr:DUF3612 domain-containing protein [Reinekea forsetii]